MSREPLSGSVAVVRVAAAIYRCWLVGCLDADTVLALVDGGLAARIASEVEDHLDGCAACRRLVSEAAAGADAARPEPGAPALPDRLGPYEVRGPIGRGGMGEVVRAYDPRLDRQVAIKLIRPHGRRMRAEDVDWFEREARAAAAISHANVLAVFDVGSHDGVPYVVSELLDGESLRARLARGPIATRQAVAWACELAHGMAAAHDRDIVHRDIKPENVFVTRDGQVKLLDFGLAVGRDDGDLEPRGLVVGTLGYMAPEQVQGDAVDHRADVFAFGAVVFEMLTGQPAFRGGGGAAATARATAALHDDPFEREPGLAAGIPPSIAQVVQRCLEKAPAARFQSARDLAFALELAGGVAARAQPARRRASRWRWIAGATVLAGASAIAAWSVRRREPAVAAVVTALDCGAREVIAAREGPDGTYVTISTGDGIAIEGLGALRTMRRTRAGALVRVPHGDGALLAAAGASSLLVLRDLGRQEDVLYGRLARIDRDGNDLPLGADLGIVLAADFMPDGSIAVIRSAGEVFKIEAPIGNQVYEAREPLLGLRISPSGAIAFLQRTRVDTYWVTRVVTIGSDHNPLQLGDWYEVTSVAWRGDALLVGGSRGELDHGVWQFERGGGARRLWSAAHAVFLQDLAGDALLVTGRAIARRIRARRPGWDRERDVSPSASSELVDLTLDGTWLSGAEAPDRKRAKQIFVRALDGGDPIAVGRGAGGLLSRDGRQVLTRTHEPPWRIIATTLAAPGEPIGSRHDVRELPAGEATYLYNAAWRSATSFVVFAQAPLGYGLYEQTLDAAPHRLGAWPGSVMQFGLFRMSPDGTAIADNDADGRPAIIDLATLKASPLTREPNAVAVGWSADGRAVWLARGPWPVEVVRHALDGTETPQLTIAAPEPSAFLEQLRVAGDGATYAYSYATLRAELYRIEALP